MVRDDTIAKTMGPWLYGLLGEYVCELGWISAHMSLWAPGEIIHTRHILTDRKCLTIRVRLFFSQFIEDQSLEILEKIYGDSNWILRQHAYVVRSLSGRPHILGDRIHVRLPQLLMVA